MLLYYMGEELEALLLWANTKEDDRKTYNGVIAKFDCFYACMGRAFQKFKELHGAELYALKAVSAVIRLQKR